MLKTNIPFKNLSKIHWLNLVLFSISIFYSLLIFSEVYFHNTYMFLGGDFLSFWASGYLANTQGYSSAYDLNQLSKIVYIYTPKPAYVTNYDFIARPTIFLPFFLLPFQILALIPLNPSFIFWSLLNLGGYIIYLKRFSSQLNINLGNKEILMFLLFFPAFKSFYWGQIGIFLLIAIGEFFLSIRDGKFYHAGVWLSLLMIKPQVLFLIIVYLLFNKQLKCLISFTLSTLSYLFISLVIAGFLGMKAWLNILYLVSTTNIRTIGVLGMQNWKMIGLKINSLFSTNIGYLITIIGILITIVIVIKILINNSKTYNDAYKYLAVFAATGLISPHFHIHSSIILVPFFLLLQKHDKSMRLILIAWIILPAINEFIINIFNLMIKYQILFPYLSNIQNILTTGGICFILSFITLILCNNKNFELNNYN